MRLRGALHGVVDIGAAREPRRHRRRGHGHGELPSGPGVQRHPPAGGRQRALRRAADSSGQVSARLLPHPPRAHGGDRVRALPPRRPDAAARRLPAARPGVPRGRERPLRGDLDLRRRHAAAGNGVGVRRPEAGGAGLARADAPRRRGHRAREGRNRARLRRRLRLAAPGARRSRRVARHPGREIVPAGSQFRGAERRRFRQGIGQENTTRQKRRGATSGRRTRRGRSAAAPCASA